MGDGLSTKEKPFYIRRHPVVGMVFERFETTGWVIKENHILQAM